MQDSFLLWKEKFVEHKYLVAKTSPKHRHREHMEKAFHRSSSTENMLRACLCNT